LHLLIKSSILTLRALAILALTITNGLLITLLSIFIKVMYLTPDFLVKLPERILALFGVFIYADFCCYNILII